MALLFVLLQPVAEAQERQFKILFLGDTAFGESYHDRLASQGREPVLRTRGYDYMIHSFRGILADADYTIVNLETPITDSFPSPLAGKKSHLHYADTGKTPDMLHTHGVDLVSLANNHTLDYGKRGLEDTFAALKARDIASCGAGGDARKAARPFVRTFELGDLTFRIALLCMFEKRDSYEKKYDFYAGPSKAGVNPIEVNQIRDVVDDLRTTYPDIFIVAFPHWGRNYKWSTDDQRDLAHAMVGAGVDLVIGHGAHLMQELEQYDGKWIIYSLGNFVFGSPGRYRKTDMHPVSAIGTLLLTETGGRLETKLRLHPIFTDNRSSNYQSRFVVDVEFSNLLKRLDDRSRPAGATDHFVKLGRDEHGRYLDLNLPR